MLGDLRKRSLRSVLWSASEGAGVAALSFGSFAVMAVKLEPHDFGVVALAGVTVFFLLMVIGHSFADALVQRPALDAEHTDTAFWSTVALGLLATGLCIGLADPIARMVGEPAVARVLPWLALVLPLNALASVPQALFRRALRFQVLAASMVAGRAVGAVTGITMAFSGFGLWSLVGQQLAGALVTAVAVIAATDWRPGLRFRRVYLKEMGGFGFYVSMSQVASGAGEQLLNLLVGTLFGTATLGYFNVAWRMVQLVRSLLSSAVYHVGLSAFARLQHDLPALSRALLQSTRMSCLVGFPIGAGMALVGPVLIAALFGTKWDVSVPILSVLALEFLPASYGMFFSALYRAVGKASWGFATALLYVVTGIAGALLLARFGVLAVAGFWVARSFLLLPLHVVLVRRLTGLTLEQVLLPLRTPFAATAIMAAVIIALHTRMPFGPLAPGVELALLVPAGILAYWLAVRLLSPDLFNTALGTARMMVAPGRHGS